MMPKHLLKCLCWLCLMSVASGLRVATFKRHYRHANCLTHCAICSLSTAQAQASAELQQVSNLPNCRHALAGCNLASWQLSSLPNLGQQRHTCCSVRQKRTSIASNFSIKCCLGCWLLGQLWMGQHTSLQHVFCLWLAIQTVHLPSIKHCML